MNSRPRYRPLPRERILKAAVAVTDAAAVMDVFAVLPWE
jgi:hypothetical protein